MWFHVLVRTHAHARMRAAQAWLLFTAFYRYNSQHV
jgi:hypothetical protein